MTRTKVQLPGGLIPLLTKQDVAAYLSVSIDSVERLEASGQIPPAFMAARNGASGRRLKRCDVNELREWLKATPRA